MRVRVPARMATGVRALEPSGADQDDDVATAGLAGRPRQAEAGVGAAAVWGSSKAARAQRP